MSAAYSSKTVLLTGAGGPAIAGMISVLRKWGYRIIAIDMLPFASGFYLADRAYVVPAGNAPDFLARLKEICLIEKVDAVISVVDEELPHVLELEALGIALKNLLNRTLPGKKTERDQLFRRLRQLRLIHTAQGFDPMQQDAWLKIRPSITSFVNDKVLQTLGESMPESASELESEEEAVIHNESGLFAAADSGE